ncbi:hypothetical protein J6590_002293 [Homalodisca vitripennis]|nr:hypothetical protein J6590_002293 [Homalodisca vitripennis]
MGAAVEGVGGVRQSTYILHAGFKMSSQSVISHEKMHCSNHHVNYEVDCPDLLRRIAFRSLPEQDHVMSFRDELYRRTTQRTCAKDAGVGELRGLGPLPCEQWPFRELSADLPSLIHSHTHNHRPASHLQFTCMLLQRLVSDAVSNLTPGIRSHVRLKRSKEIRRQRSSKRNIYIVSTSETPINRDGISPIWSAEGVMVVLFKEVCLRKSADFGAAVEGVGGVRQSTYILHAGFKMSSQSVISHEKMHCSNHHVNYEVDCPDLLRRIAFRSLPEQDHVMSFRDELYRRTTQRTCAKDAGVGELRGLGPLPCEQWPFRELSADLPSLIHSHTHNHRPASHLQFTCMLLQRLVSDAVSNLTPGIRSHVRLKRSKEIRRQRSSKRNIYIVSTSETPINSFAVDDPIIPSPRKRKESNSSEYKHNKIKQARLMGRSNINHKGNEVSPKHPEFTCRYYLEDVFVDTRGQPKVPKPALMAGGTRIWVAECDQE